MGSQSFLETMRDGENLNATHHEVNEYAHGIDAVGPPKRPGRCQFNVHWRRGAFCVRAVLLATSSDGQQGVGGDGWRTLDM